MFWVNRTVKKQMPKVFFQKKRRKHLLSLLLLTYYYYYYLLIIIIIIIVTYYYYLYYLFHLRGSSSFATVTQPSYLLSFPTSGQAEGGSCEVTRTIGVAASRGGRSSPWGHLPSLAAVVSRATAINALMALCLTDKYNVHTLFYYNVL